MNKEIHWHLRIVRYREEKIMLITDEHSNDEEIHLQSTT
jgi:hypothetical protein